VFCLLSCFAWASNAIISYGNLALFSLVGTTYFVVLAAWALHGSLLYPNFRIGMDRQDEEGEVKSEKITSYDELLDTFIPDIDACQQWTLSEDMGMKTEWVLVLCEYNVALSGLAAAGDALEMEQAKLESAADEIEYVKTYSMTPGPGQVVDLVVDLVYNKDLLFGDCLALHLPHFKINDHHTVKKKTVETKGASMETFKRATFFAKSHELTLKHESRMLFKAGDPIQLRIPRLVVVPKRGDFGLRFVLRLLQWAVRFNIFSGLFHTCLLCPTRLTPLSPLPYHTPTLSEGISREHSYGFTAQASALSGSSMVHAMASALIPVPEKPTHIQLRKKQPSTTETAVEIERIRAAMRLDEGGYKENVMQEEEGTEMGRSMTKQEGEIEMDGEETWASCLYDDEFNGMAAPEPDDGLPRHRTAHVHKFDNGMGPNQIMYMPTAKSAKLMESLAPAVKYVYNEEIVALLDAEGKHRIISQKTDAHEDPERESAESEVNVWERGATGGTSRVATGETYYSGRASSRQGILKRQASPPPRLSTAAGVVSSWAISICVQGLGVVIGLPATNNQY